MLVGTAIWATIPLILYPDHPSYDPLYLYNNKSRPVAILLITGNVLGSISFFISSSKNKKRAAALTIHNQNIYFQQQNSLALKAQPTLTLKVKL